jgi:hypothetical protein
MPDHHLDTERAQRAWRLAHHLDKLAFRKPNVWSPSGHHRCLGEIFDIIRCFWHKFCAKFSPDHQSGHQSSWKKPSKITHLDTKGPKMGKTCPDTKCPKSGNFDLASEGIIRGPVNMSRFGPFVSTPSWPVTMTIFRHVRYPPWHMTDKLIWILQYIQQGRKFIRNSARPLSQEFHKYCFRYTLFMDFISLNNLTTLWY